MENILCIEEEGEIDNVNNGPQWTSETGPRLKMRVAKNFENKESLRIGSALVRSQDKHVELLCKRKLMKISFNNTG